MVPPFYLTMKKILFFVLYLISVGANAQTPITTASQLQGMSLDGNYILMNDIDLSSITLNPIGGMYGSFTGTLDGNGHTITLGYINSSYQKRGLFSEIGTSGIVKNLNVNGQYIENYSQDYCYVGVIAAMNYGTITNCNTSVDINSSGVYNNSPKMTYSGGIAGHNAGTISYCFASGNIFGASYNEGTGGIVGTLSRLIESPQIDHCIYIGNLTKHYQSTGNKTGMICGYADTYSNYITNCYYIQDKGFSGIGSFSSSSPVSDDGHCSVINQFNLRALAKTGGVYASTSNSVFKEAILTFPYEISFSTTDGTSAFTNITGENANVTFHRAFTSKVKSTICLPFNIPSDQAAALGKFYTFIGIKDGTNDVIQMQQVTTDLVANTAYVFEPMPFGHSEELGITFKNVTIANTLTPSTSSSQVQFIGTYSPKTWSTGDSDLGKVYGFAIAGYESDGFSAGQFVILGAGASAAPFRAYLKYNPQTLSISRRASLSLPDVLKIEWISSDQVTGITTINRQKLSNGWFTLDGCKLDKTPTKKGIYVNNGKKVIIK